jgi:aldehyde:ferredoxin oxidoreductase
MYKAATGRLLPWEEAVKTGLRAVNLMRAFNLRGGYEPVLEVPSPRYGSRLVDGSAAGTSVMDQWPQMRDTYYREMGWNPASGRPLRETLRALGLEEVAGDLWDPPQETSSSR